MMQMMKEKAKTGKVSAMPPSIKPPPLAEIFPLEGLVPGQRAEGECARTRRLPGGPAFPQVTPWR